MRKYRRYIDVYRRKYSMHTYRWSYRIYTYRRTYGIYTFQRQYMIYTNRKTYRINICRKTWLYIKDIHVQVHIVHTQYGGVDLEGLSLSQVSDLSSKLREMQQYWVQLPAALCSKLASSSSSSQDKCWNGMTKARWVPSLPLLWIQQIIQSQRQHRRSSHGSYCENRLKSSSTSCSCIHDR